MMYVRHIIRRMLEFARRWGPAFLAAFIASILGIIPVLIYVKDYRTPVIVFLLVLASICLGFTIYALVCDIKEGLRKDRERKREA
ncbi:MAG: hypothetical protein V1724_01230, partial [Chloroflexota bacterium]